MTRLRAVGRGLTLVEVMVALAVLSLIVVALGASLRGLAQSAERVDRRVDEIDEMRTGVAFLRELFAAASPVRGGDPQHTLLFEAGSQQFAWIAVMPARFGAGGQHAFRLAAEPLDDGSTALVLRYAPWRAQATAFPDWTAAASRVLVHRLESLGLAYDGQGLQTGWRPAWGVKDHLPARVRLDVGTFAGPWPPVVLPLRAATRSGGGFVIGGGTQ